MNKPLRIPQPKIRKQAVAKLQGGWFCVYCDATENLCMDHLLSSAYGGTSEITNLVLACGKCNNLKGQWKPDALRQKGHTQIADTVCAIQKERSKWDIDHIESLLAQPLENTDDKYNKYELFCEPTRFGKFLHDRLRELGISKYQIRRRLKLAGWTVDKWISGQTQRITFPYLVQLSEILKTPIDDMIDKLDFTGITPEWVHLRKQIYRKNWVPYNIAAEADCTRGILTSIEKGREKLSERRYAKLNAVFEKIGLKKEFDAAIASTKSLQTTGTRGSYCKDLDVVIHEKIDNKGWKIKPFADWINTVPALQVYGSSKQYATYLNISPAHFCRIKKKQTLVSPAFAEKICRMLNYHVIEATDTYIKLNTT